MKAYTDLSQSKKLAEFLPLESADMRYSPLGDMHPWVWIDSFIEKDATPCWSLSALLDVLPKIVNNETLFVETSPSLWHIGYRNIYIARGVNLVDTCVEMIMRLNELHLL